MTAAPPDLGEAGRLQRVVALGGGHGLSRSLQALARVADTVTAVVTVADDGGSSGRLRRDLDVVAPGDLRMALAALSRDPGLRELLQYRFDRGELSGHSLGNLMLVALEDISGGSLVVALDRLGRLLDVPGRVLPCTTTAVTLHADTADGPVQGQATIAASHRIERVWLAPGAPDATPAAVEAVLDADLVVLGPGSLYTSLIPNLLVPAIGDALLTARAPRVLVANLREQKGETEGMGLDEHLVALVRHLPGLRLDALIAHAGPPASGGPPLALDEQAVRARVGSLIRADLLDGADGHDPEALADALARVAEIHPVGEDRASRPAGPADPQRSG